MKEVYQKSLFFTLIFIASLFVSEQLYAQVTYSANAKKSEKQKTQNTRQSSTMGSNQFKQSWRLSAGFGPSLFFGDTKQYQYYPVMNYESEWKFGGSLLLERNISPVFSLRGQALYSNLAGTRRVWKKYFNSELIEFNFNTAINLNNLIAGYNANRPWNINIVVGVGLLNFNTTVYELGTDKVLAKRGFGNGSGIDGRTLEGIIMGGLGIDYQLNSNWSLRLETANRALNTDLLDNYAGGFKYDIYNHTSLGLSYTFRSSGRNIKMVPEAEPGLLIVDPDQQAPVTPDKTNTQTESFNRVIDVLELSPEKKVEPKTETPKIIEEEITEVPQYNVPAKDAIEYRVQIRARYGRQISVQELARSYNFSASEIQENTFNGYYIYTVGSFSNYDQAAQRRNTIRATNGVYDAFVVAFRNGIRLSKLP
ncbi:MAG: SPOR domain-containing protein [Bacteroidetes bacterium]|nr:SPOR domain-containing protein [Bacteroidota bacterium]